MSILSGTQMALLQCYKILLVCALLCKTFHPRRENNLLVSNSTCLSLYHHTNADLGGLIACFFGTSALAQFGESWRNGWPVKTGDANIILKASHLTTFIRNTVESNDRNGDKLWDWRSFPDCCNELKSEMVGMVCCRGGGLLFSHPPIITVSYPTLAASEVRNWKESCPRMIKHSDLHIADSNLDDRSADPTETLSEAVLNHAPN